MIRCYVGLLNDKSSCTLVLSQCLTTPPTSLPVRRSLLRWTNQSSSFLPSTTWTSSPRPRRCPRQSPSACPLTSHWVRLPAFLMTCQTLTAVDVSVSLKLMRFFFWVFFHSGGVQDCRHGTHQILPGAEDRRGGFLRARRGRIEKQQVSGTCPGWSGAGGLTTLEVFFSTGSQV